jgi:DNA-binding response OmpR family regulator
VVDDDPVMGGTLVHRLELEGYWALDKALNGLRSVRPDLVVCDIRLPNISGEQVFLSIIAAIGWNAVPLRDRMRASRASGSMTKAGAVDYMAKPYAFTDLLDRIPRLIAQRPGAAGLQSRAKRISRTAGAKVQGLDEQHLGRERS